MKKGKIVLIAISGIVLPLLLYTLLLNMGTRRYNDSCAICHQMRKKVRNVSGYVHRGQQCRDCHKTMDSMTHMFQVHFGMKKPKARGLDGGTTAQCVKCHADTWRKEHVLNKSILFSHERHSKRVPGCTACHSDVSHPQQKRVTKPLVTSDICKKCHEKKDIAAGHPPSSVPDLHLYEKQPHPKNWLLTHNSEAKEEGNNCSNCHEKTYCSNCHEKFRLHPAGWRQTHGAEARKDLAPCQVCHLPEGCADCHAKKLPKSHGQNWTAEHSNNLKIDNCMPCHRLNFCQACHARTKPSSHTDKMIRNHKGIAKGNEKVCALCHNQNPCMDCHKVEMPHPKNWVPSHGKSAATDAQKAVCSKCHEKSYCAACHEKKFPTSHLDKKKWSSTHGESALRKRSDCSLCHKENFCESCHHVQMPHPRNWVPTHKLTVAAKPDTCALCHKTSMCRECHKSVKPASHTDPTVKFKSNHGRFAKRGGQCATCHDRQSFCDKCHGIEIPHQPSMLKDHRSVVKDKGKNFCAKCHQADFCKTCHMKKAKHASDWTAKHGAQARKDAMACMTCHEQDSCLDCHGGKPAGGLHPDCGMCHNEKTMKFNGVADTCAMCHDDVMKKTTIGVKKDCTLCHKPHVWKPKSGGGCTDCHSMKKSGLHSKSDHSYCTACHKKHAWKPNGRDACMGCHMDKKDHNAPELCWECHPFK